MKYNIAAKEANCYACQWSLYKQSNSGAAIEELRLTYLLTYL